MPKFPGPPGVLSSSHSVLLQSCRRARRAMTRIRPLRPSPKTRSAIGPSQIHARSMRKLCRTSFSSLWGESRSTRLKVSASRVGLSLKGLRQARGSFRVRMRMSPTWRTWETRPCPSDLSSRARPGAHRSRGEPGKNATERCRDPSMRKERRKMS